MLVTIMSDASFCPTFNVAGYGYWIASNRGSQAGGGSMRDKVPNSTVAEMQAVVIALHCAIRDKLVLADDRVLIQIDCKPAILTLLRQAQACDLGKEAERIFRKYIERYRLEVEFRHVKAHTGNRSKRSVSNAYCDGRAKSAMRIARDRERATVENEIRTLLHRKLELQNVA